MYPRSTTVRTSRWVVGTGSPHAEAIPLIDDSHRRPHRPRTRRRCGRRTGTPPDGAASPTVHSGHASFHLPTNCNEDCAPRRRHGRVGRCRTGARRAPDVASAPRPESPHARLWLTPRSLASCLSLVRRRRSAHCGKNGFTFVSLVRRQSCSARRVLRPVRRLLGRHERRDAEVRHPAARSSTALGRGAA